MIQNYKNVFKAILQSYCTALFQACPIDALHLSSYNYIAGLISVRTLSRDERAAGARQARDRRATGARRAGGRRAPYWRRAGMPFSTTIACTRAACAYRAFISRTDAFRRALLIERIFRQTAWVRTHPLHPPGYGHDIYFKEPGAPPLSLNLGILS